MSRPTAVISGGSLGGLVVLSPLLRRVAELPNQFAGIVMKAAGWNVIILERSPSLADRGAGIACMPQFLAFFKKFDRTKTTFWTHAAGRQHLRLDGTVMNFEPDFRPLDLTSWLATYAVARDNFDRDPDIPEGQLIQYCPSSSVAGYCVQDGKVFVQYSQAGTLHDQEGDLLIIAEGASSPQCHRLLPAVQRRYVGYVVFRGLVAESDLDPDLTASVAPFVTFYHGKGRDYIQFLCYLIPGPTGSLEPGKRSLNWAWYRNFAEGDPELQAVLTDAEGCKHEHSTGIGQASPAMIRILRAETNALPPAMATIVQATQAPFVQAITEAVAPQAVFEDGRVLLWADALCNIRPHTGSGAAHAARQAEALHDILQATPGDFTEEQRRRISEEWEPDALAYAHSLHRLGKEMGQAALRASHPMRGDL